MTRQAPPPAEIAHRSLVFRDEALPAGLSLARGHFAEFSARPRSEWDLALNRLIHTSVLTGRVDSAEAYSLLGLHIVALVLPPALAKWLAHWSRAQVERAVACILIDAAGIDGHADGDLDDDDVDDLLEWPPPPHHWTPPPSSPDNVFGAPSPVPKPQSGDNDDNASYASDDIPPCPALGMEPATPPLSTLIRGIPAAARAHPCPALPFVTEASKQLDELLQAMAGVALWSVPVKFVAAHARRVPWGDTPADKSDAEQSSSRSVVSCLNTVFELEKGLTFNTPLESTAPALTSGTVRALLGPWTQYKATVAKAGVPTRQALHAFGRLIATDMHRSLWDRVDLVLDLAGLGPDPCGGRIVTPSVGRVGLSTKGTHKRSAPTESSGCQKRVRRLLELLPSDLLRDVLIPRIVVALSE